MIRKGNRVITVVNGMEVKGTVIDIKDTQYLIRLLDGSEVNSTIDIVRPENEVN